MGVFDVNFGTLVRQLLPVRLRNAMQLAWLNCLVSPVVYVYNLFYANRAANLYNLGHNGQVVKLAAALNDAFDNTLRRIYISDPVFDDADWLYQRDELKPLYFYTRAENKPVYTYLRSEVYAAGGVQFVVYVPTGLVYDVNRMKALINQYRLVSKNNYVITNF